MECKRPGVLEVDHITPLNRGGEPWDMGNLAAMCRDCHIRKTRLDERGPEPMRDAWRALVDALT